MTGHFINLKENQGSVDIWNCYAKFPSASFIGIE